MEAAMEFDEKTLRCDGCGIEIRWKPVVAGRLTFCCGDCLHGRGCECQDSLEIEDERLARKQVGSAATSLSEYT
jgi:hypothetical protein